MKHALIACMLLAGTTTVKAQTTAGISHNQWEENDNRHHKTSATPHNEFANTEMSANNGVLTFSDVPTLKKPAYAVITNAEGEFIKQGKITTEQNTMDIKRLRGGLYFVTIVYRDQSKKAFTLNL